ncbi:MAG: hypothetical protein ACFE78_01185 [Candidatus Hodarchaeota archaeon]
MYKQFKIKDFNQGRLFGKISLLSLLLLGFLLSINPNIKKHNNDNSNIFNEIFKPADSNSNLIEGKLNPLNVTDFGNLYNTSQCVSLTSQEELNLNYYLDDSHGWKVSQIDASVSNIQDKRDWVAEKNYYELDTPYRKYQSFQNKDPPGAPPHNYSSDLDHDPTNPANIDKTINEPGASAIRLHFSRIEFETDWDILCIYDESNNLQFTFTGSATDYYTPWITSDTLKITINSDGFIEWYGYNITFYEFYNETTNYYDYNNSWGYNNGTNTRNFGPGEIANNTAMYVTLLGEPYRDAGYPMSATYYEDDFSEIYQNLTIPRGSVIDGYISFDYYAESAMDSNENFLYCEINNKKIYSKGLGDIVEAGRQTWHHSGKIYLDLWINTSNIFENIQNNQNFNISIGIMSGASVTYSGFDDRFQQIFWFDNVSLVLTTLANSSQNGINLKLNSQSLTEGNEWGMANTIFSGNWETNPVILTVNTTSPSLTFDLDTILYGYHKVTSKINQQNEDGISYTILNNGTIFCDFYHNFYMPSFYSDFEFIVDKPLNWKITSILDPTFLLTSFEGGNYGDNYAKVNKSHAKFPGWWRVRAILPNYILDQNTYVSKNGQRDIMEFNTGDFGKIKTQINYSDDIPAGLDQTIANLSIYDPQGNIWYEETKVPESNGTVIFSQFGFSSLNTTGGIYNFTLFWSNRTSLGGLKSYFTVIHESYITILKPDDAKEDLVTGGSVGDIIPLRIFVRDFENNNTLSDAIVSFNWSSGTRYMTQAALGIYEAVLDTGDLGTLGLYTIVIKMNKTGYKYSNITLKINLGEETILQRLESESHIVLNANSTIRFYYYADFDEEGIPGAYVTVNISNPSYYNVHDLLDGYYEIEFSTVFIDTPGTYILEFEFSAPGYEEQRELYQFNIIYPPSDNNGPNILLLIILFTATVIIGVLGALSLRSYVILPRKRKKESRLLARTQRFKDLSNIQAIVIINRMSGIPLFSQSYSILEKHKKELFSGFIQAITTIGEEIVGKNLNHEERESESKIQPKERILELDFKYFYCLVFDKEDIRIVFVLKEKASQRLKEQIMHLSLGLTLQLSEHIENWDGSLDQFEDLVPPIINDYIELYYKEPFIINTPISIAKIRKESELSTMETRILNVIHSIAKNKSEFQLDFIIESVHEHNKDKIIDALESLIQKKVIIPKTN